MAKFKNITKLDLSGLSVSKTATGKVEVKFDTASLRDQLSQDMGSFTIGSDANALITLSGKIKINGNVIQAVDGNENIKLFTSGKTQVVGELDLNNNTLTMGAPDSTSTIQHENQPTNDTAGQNMIIKASAGKGNGIGGNIIFQTAKAPGGATSSTQGVHAAVLTLDQDGDATIARNCQVDGDLSVNGDDATFASSTSYKPQITIKNTAADNKPPEIVFLKNRGGTSTNNADSILSITAEGYDNANNSQDYGNIRFLCNSNTAGSEAGEMYIYVAGGSQLKQAFYALGETSGITGKVGVTLGFGDDSKQTINGLLNIKSEQGSSPSAPSAGNGGYLYTKADGKPYWISDDVGETDLTAGTSTLQFEKVSFNETQMNSAHSTALEVVAAQGANKVIIPISCTIFADQDSSTTQGNTVNLFLGAGAAGSSTSGAGLWGYIKGFMRSEAGDRIYNLPCNSQYTEMGQSLTALDNQPLKLKFNTAITSGSINSIIVHITYVVHTNT
tara:strand:+ start:642 stop:2147 length:1506 start_codon:yes stop_codon:yes gene_type:complete